MLKVTRDKAEMPGGELEALGDRYEISLVIRKLRRSHGNTQKEKE